VFIGGTDWEQGFTFGAGIGWFPLGPREVYVPPYRASVEYVRNVNRPYVTGIDAARVDVRNVPYANRAKPGAVTVVSRRTFAGSEPVAPAAVRLAESELGRAPVTGTAPSLAPTPDSIQARPRGASQPETRPPVAQRPGFRLVNPSRESVEQARLEPAVAPRAQRKAASPAGSQQQVKRVRKLVNGPNGPVWIWVVEEEPGDG
jgi:hypothetical protein